MARSNKVLAGTLFLAMFASTFAVPTTIDVETSINANANANANNKICDTCETVFTKVDTIFKNQRLIDYTVELIETNVCEKLPEAGQAKCNETMEERIPDIFEGIATHWLDPTTDCEELHLCKKSDNALVSSKMTDNDLKCDICTKVVQFIGDDVLQSQRVEDFVTTELDLACTMLPETYGELCETAVNASIPQVLSYVSTFVESNGCTIVGLCTNNDVENKDILIYFPPMWKEFNEFVKEFGKVYETATEYMSRLAVYRENLEFIKKHTTDTLKLEMNKYGDMTPAEFSIHKKGGCFLDVNIEDNGGCKMFVSNLTSSDLPVFVDWRKNGAVTPVKNQGHCGSCWSFSATGAMEGAYYLKTGELLSFSEQELVDCSGSFGNHGCNGGLMDYGFEFALENGMCTEAEEPYKAVDMKCEQCKEVAKFEGCYDVPNDDEEQLMKAVSQQPVSIAIEADNSVFMFYKGGIIDGATCGTKLDHGVLIVGYGVDNGNKYWLVKNSWGALWGENGYVRIARDETKRGAGVCGIAAQPSFIEA